MSSGGQCVLPVVISRLQYRYLQAPECSLPCDSRQRAATSVFKGVIKGELHESDKKLKFRLRDPSDPSLCM